MSEITDLIDERLAAAGPATPAVPAQRHTAARARFAAGLTDPARLRQELRDLGYEGERLERLVTSALFDRGRRRAELQADVAGRQFRQGVLDESLLKARLIELGFSPDEAELRVMEELVRRPAPATRPVAVGLQLLPEAEGLVLEISQRPTAVGLQIVTPPEAAVPEARPRPVAVGLQIITVSGGL